MRIYILESDRRARAELEALIEEEDMGTVVGRGSRWEEACMEAEELCPDLILTAIPGSASKTALWIESMKKLLPKATVILLSQGGDMERIRAAYENGAELLIHKPLIRQEVRSVLHHAEMTQAVEWMVGRTGKNRLSGERALVPPSGDEEKERGQASERREKDCSQALIRLNGILREIGILNEGGSKDIVRLIRYLLEEELDLREITVCELCSRMGQNCRSVEQRIRRAAAAGMANLASRGMDDYADPIFNELGARLYILEQIKREMSYLTGNSDSHGNVRVRKFLSGLLACCKER